MYNYVDAVEGVIWDSTTATYIGVITSSDLLICLNRQVCFVDLTNNQYLIYKSADPSVPLVRLLDKDIKEYRGIDM